MRREGGGKLACVCVCMQCCLPHSFVAQARTNLRKFLSDRGLYVGQSPNPMALAVCSRSGDVLEPLLKPQVLSLLPPLVALGSCGVPAHLRSGTCAVRAGW